jgi:hypothetical protein
MFEVPNRRQLSPLHRFTATLSGAFGKHLILVASTTDCNGYLPSRFKQLPGCTRTITLGKMSSSWVQLGSSLHEAFEPRSHRPLTSSLYHIVGVGVRDNILTHHLRTVVVFRASNPQSVWTDRKSSPGRIRL